MPQKKAKKTKMESPKKATKVAPKKAPASVLKKAAKAVAKKVTSALVGGAAKKKAPAVPKKVPVAKAAAKPAKDSKEKELKLAKKPLPAAAAPAPAKAAGKKLPPPAAQKAKASPAPAPAPASAKGAGKKKGEVVLEVPAPKGVALLGREGKKKSKAEAAMLSRKNRCREPGCEHELLLSGFCRLHYIKNWRKIKRKEAILASGQLNNYVEELVSKYPDKYLDVIRQDLASEKEWSKVVVDLELESSEDDPSRDEDLDGVPEGTSRRERDFDDDSDTF